jgi:hypothetical protein
MQAFEVSKEQQCEEQRTMWDGKPPFALSSIHTQPSPLSQSLFRAQVSPEEYDEMTLKSPSTRKQGAFPTRAVFRDHRCFPVPLNKPGEWPIAP